MESFPYEMFKKNYADMYGESMTHTLTIDGITEILKRYTEFLIDNNELVV